LARIVSSYRNEANGEIEPAGTSLPDWQGLQEMSPLQIAQAAFERTYHTTMPAELTDLFKEAYEAAIHQEGEA
jgi:exonuclease SbcD